MMYIQEDGMRGDKFECTKQRWFSCGVTDGVEHRGEAWVREGWQTNWKRLPLWSEGVNLTNIVAKRAKEKEFATFAPHTA